MHEQWLSYGIMALLGVSVLSLLFKTIKYGGLKAAIFGAPILTTYGEVRGMPFPFARMVVEVYKLGGTNPGKAVGLIIAAKGCGGYQGTPITLSTSEARRLVILLEAATAQTSVA